MNSKYHHGVIIFLSIVWLVADVSADEPSTYTCAYIQQHSAELEGQRVRVEGITVVESACYANAMTVISDPGGGPWAALTIYDGGDSPRLIAERGETVEAVGIVTEYYGFTELVTYDELEYPPHTTGWGEIPSEVVVTTGTVMQEMYESCVVIIFGAEIMAIDTQECVGYTLDDGSGAFCFKSRDIDPPVPLEVGAVIDCLRGHVFYSWEEYSLRLRNDQDWLCPGWVPTPTPLPEPTVTPTPIVSLGVRIDMPLMVHPGEDFWVTGELMNPGAPMVDIPVFFVLEWIDTFWFWPGWTFFSPASGGSIDYTTMPVPEGITSVEVIPGFIWPDTGSQTVSGFHFYGAMLSPDISGFLGSWADVTWGYGPD